MSVLDFDAYLPKEKVEKPPCPVKFIVLALARDHQGIRAKLLAETLHENFPKQYPKPLVKFYHDVQWRETLVRLRKATKRWDYVSPVIVFANKRLIGDDDDLHLYIKEKLFLMIDPKKIVAFKNMKLLEKLQIDPQKTYVYFDMSINYRPVGRMIFQVESDTMPKSTKEFVQLCCSQNVPLPDANYRRSKFAGSVIQRVVQKGWIRITTVDSQRVYTKGKRETAALSHNRRGTLSLNVDQLGWLGSHVFITLDQHLWMDKMYKAIGYLVDGEFILHMIENVETAYEHPKLDIVITDNGILHSPLLMATESLVSAEIQRASSIINTFKDEYRTVLNAYVRANPLFKADVQELVSEESQEEQVAPSEEIEGEESHSKLKVIASEHKWEQPPTLEQFEQHSESELMAFSTDSFYGTTSSLKAISLNTKKSLELKVGDSSKQAVWSQDSNFQMKSSRSVIETDRNNSINVGSSRDFEVINVTPEESAAEAIEEEQSINEGIDETGGEFEKSAEIVPIQSEPDIRYTYSVPTEMVDMRTGYKKFEGEKYVQEYSKVGMKLPTRVGTGLVNYDDEVRDFRYVSPHMRMGNDGKYTISEKTMEQVTPQLLLAWAERIDYDEQICSVEKAVKELVNAALDQAEPIDENAHPGDAVSMEDCTERYKKCLFSLPPELLHLLREALQNIQDKQKQEGGPALLVTGDSTSEIKIPEKKSQPQPSPSEDVISGCVFTLIEYTRRMIESCTELVPNMNNLDFVTSLVDEVIYEKMQTTTGTVERINVSSFNTKIPLAISVSSQQKIVEDLTNLSHSQDTIINEEMLQSKSGIIT